MMTPRELLLTAINNEKPERLPCQVHNWMQYYLDTYLGGRNAIEAYEYFGMDMVLYTSGRYLYSDKALKNWIVTRKDFPKDADGVSHYTMDIETPEGTLHVKGSTNKYTFWETEHMVKNEKDFDLFAKYFPEPYGCDWSDVEKLKETVGDRGIVRGISYSYGQVAPWQTLCYLMGTEQTIFKAIDDPDWTHYALDALCQKLERAIDVSGKIRLDLVETGGGAGSSTVISPAMHEEFCLPYDKRQHAALKAQGAKIVYHLCGGHMPLLEIVAQNGADCLETLTPPGMGADCRMKEAKERVGDKLAFIGGFDQLAGFERGTPEIVEKMVRELFEACPNGGYICSPSDHFFEGSVENIRAFVRACKACRY